MHNRRFSTVFTVNYNFSFLSTFLSYGVLPLLNSYNVPKFCGYSCRIIIIVIIIRIGRLTSEFGDVIISIDIFQPICL